MQKVCFTFVLIVINKFYIDDIVLGIYIRSDDTSVPEEFRGIGVRIEDDVVITPDNPLVLTGSCPKEVEDIENLMATTWRLILDSGSSNTGSSTED